MGRESNHPDARRHGSAFVDPGGVFDGDAELVLVTACRDLVRRIDGDIGVDADSRIRAQTEARGDFAQHIQFRLGLDIELADPGFQSLRDFIPRLADAGEHDVRRSNAGRHRARELPARYHVRSRSQTREGTDHREIAVGLHRVTDPGVELA